MFEFSRKKNTDKYYTSWTIYTLLEKVTALFLHFPLLPSLPPGNKKANALRGGEKTFSDGRG